VNWSNAGFCLFDFSWLGGKAPDTFFFVGLLTGCVHVGNSGAAQLLQSFPDSLVSDLCPALLGALPAELATRGAPLLTLRY